MRIVSLYFWFLHVASTESAGINVLGLEGQPTSFQCVHRWAYSNTKFFCKDPCNKRDVLATVAAGSSATSGRITLKDFGNGSFTVTFSRLQLSDSHLYYCAVQRSVRPTYTGVNIIVLKAPTTTVLPSSIRPRMTVTTLKWGSGDSTGSTPTSLSTAYTTWTSEEENSDLYGVLYATAGVSAAVAVLILAAGYRKCRRPSRPQQLIYSQQNDSRSVLDLEGCQEYNESAKKNQLAIKSPNNNGPASKSSGELPVYENISAYRDTVNFGCADQRGGRETPQGIYVTVLP